MIVSRNVKPHKIQRVLVVDGGALSCYCSKFHHEGSNRLVRRRPSISLVMTFFSIYVHLFVAPFGYVLLAGRRFPPFFAPPLSIYTCTLDVCSPSYTTPKERKKGSGGRMGSLYRLMQYIKAVIRCRRRLWQSSLFPICTLDSEMLSNVLILQANDRGAGIIHNSPNQRTTAGVVQSPHVQTFHTGKL